VFCEVHRCGEVGRDLVVNFVNTNYPNDDTSAGDCKFRMVVTSQHTCQVRNLVRICKQVSNMHMYGKLYAMEMSTLVSLTLKGDHGLGPPCMRITYNHVVYYAEYKVFYIVL